MGGLGRFSPGLPCKIAASRFVEVAYDDSHWPFRKFPVQRKIIPSLPTSVPVTNSANRTTRWSRVQVRDPLRGIRRSSRIPRRHQNRRRIRDCGLPRWTRCTPSLGLMCWRSSPGCCETGISQPRRCRTRFGDFWKSATLRDRNRSRVGCSKWRFTRGWPSRGVREPIIGRYFNTVGFGRRRRGSILRD